MIPGPRLVEKGFDVVHHPLSVLVGGPDAPPKAQEHGRHTPLLAGGVEDRRLIGLPEVSPVGAVPLHEDGVEQVGDDVREAVDVTLAHLVDHGLRIAGVGLGDVAKLRFEAAHRCLQPVGGLVHADDDVVAVQFDGGPEIRRVGVDGHVRDRLGLIGPLLACLVGLFVEFDEILAAFVLLDGERRAGRLLVHRPKFVIRVLALRGVGRCHTRPDGPRRQNS